MARTTPTAQPEGAAASPPRIACLGWGSLIWDPRSLPIRRQWFDDGPLAPVELVRQSKGGRMTFVLDAESEPVRLLWAQMDPMDLDKAREALRAREGITAKDWAPLIGSWFLGDAEPDLIPGIEWWARDRGLHAVIWTALDPKFGTEEQRPTVQQVLDHLGGLVGSERDHAERYIRWAPRQIDTAYRRQVEARLGWTPLPPEALAPRG